MLILEGPDGAGKTTLSQMLLHDGIVSGVMLSPGREDRTRLWESTRQYQVNFGENKYIAVDRFFYSEIVYGSLLRGKVQFSVQDSINMFSYLAKYCFQVFCLPGIGSLKFVPTENPDTIARIHGIHKRYEEIARCVDLFTHDMHIYKWDDPESYPSLRNKIERWRKDGKR